MKVKFNLLDIFYSGTYLYIEISINISLLGDCSYLRIQLKRPHEVRSNNIKHLIVCTNEYQTYVFFCCSSLNNLCICIHF